MRQDASRDRDWRDWLKPWRWPHAIVHGFLCVVLLSWAGWLCFGPIQTQGLARLTYDRLQQWRVWASGPDERLLIIDIDERSLAEMSGEFGRWPWPRDTLASLLEHAEAEGAVAFVFDILFSDPDRLRPGGDHALAAAVETTKIGLFSVMRLPATFDADSELTIDRVPGLTLAPTRAASAPRVALVLPFMDAMVRSGRLGTNTVQRDVDGKLRRFAMTEALRGGWRLLSMPAAVARSLDQSLDTSEGNSLIIWRRRVDAYPRVSFATAWACAEGRQHDDCPELKGRIVLLGSTAAALHDAQATPLSNQHAGIDVLATLVDNALHQRVFRELTPAWRFVLAGVALVAAWAVARRGSVGSTRRALFGLPILLVALAYASLHTERVYFDLMLPAGLVLSYLSAVVGFDTLRRNFLGASGNVDPGEIALVCGAPATLAERLERTVFDIAASRRLRVTGGGVAAGDGGKLHGFWIVWGFSGPERAQEIAGALTSRLVGVWTRSTLIVRDADGAPLPSLVQALRASFDESGVSAR